MSESKPRYVVKFGELYSCGRPSQDGSFGLQLSTDIGEAWMAESKQEAKAHAVAWTGDAIDGGLDTPRVVKLRPKLS